MKLLLFLILLFASNCESMAYHQVIIPVDTLVDSTVKASPQLAVADSTYFKKKNLNPLSTVSVVLSVLGNFLWISEFASMSPDLSARLVIGLIMGTVGFAAGIAGLVKRRKLLKIYENVPKSKRPGLGKTRSWWGIALGFVSVVALIAIGAFLISYGI